MKLALDNAGPDRVVVVLSQVPPGLHAGAAAAGQQLYYQVETLVFGRAVERATQPERYIVGCPDPASRCRPRLKSYLEGFDCPILPMRYESAELAKISINCCLVASVTVANTLAELCERIGADWSEIAPALKLDRRIGAYSYLVAGARHRRRQSRARSRDRDPVLAGVRHRRRRHQGLRAQQPPSQGLGDRGRCTRRCCGADPDVRLGVLGLAYKENTHSMKNSPSLALIQLLASLGVEGVRSGRASPMRRITPA